MIKTFVTISFLVFGLQAHALVSSPSTVTSGEWAIESKSTSERGKVEPNENKDSFQSAKINIYQLSAAYGLSGISFGNDHFLRLDYRYFTSGKEEVGGQVFYEEDTGNAATLTYGFNFVHEPVYSAGMYASVSPLASYNKDKFSSPRVDLWALGLRSGLEFNSNWFTENSIHYGSGQPGRQNSYLAFTNVVGLKLSGATEWPVTLKFGPYAELDLQERADAKYDAAFSAPGRTDRIRSMKVGVIGGVDINLPSNWYLSGGYVQKLGGYDAPATNALFVSVGVKF